MHSIGTLSRLNKHAQDRALAQAIEDGDTAKAQAIADAIVEWDEDDEARGNEAANDDSDDPLSVLNTDAERDSRAFDRFMRREQADAEAQRARRAEG
jgi:hypothetical protein